MIWLLFGVLVAIFLVFMVLLWRSLRSDSEQAAVGRVLKKYGKRDGGGLL